MCKTAVLCRGFAALVIAFFALPAAAQTFKVQCPESTPYPAPGGQIKCQQLSGGDGFATMGDGTQTYLFAFGPLSGLPQIYNGLPGTTTNTEFNVLSPVGAGAPSDLVGMPDGSFTFNGAIGLAPDPDCYATTDHPMPADCAGPGALTGHVDPRPIMDVGVLNGSMPAPMMAIDEDDELFLTLTNVGQVMRPDLFEQHTVHFHGYPNASAFYDGVPDASLAINIGGSFTYYYLAPDAGTYFWHCHITPPEHLQMGMTGQLFVRPRQNRVNRQSASCPGGSRGPARGSDIAHARRIRASAQALRRRHPVLNPGAGSQRRQRTTAPRNTPTTTATARRSTTSSTRSRSTASTRTSTSSA